MGLTCQDWHYSSRGQHCFRTFALSLLCPNLMLSDILTFYCLFGLLGAKPEQRADSMPHLLHKSPSQNQNIGKLLLETTAKGNSKPQLKIWTRFPRNHS